MKKLFQLFFLGILFVLVLTSCQTPSEQPDDTSTDVTEPNNPSDDSQYSYIEYKYADENFEEYYDYEERQNFEYTWGTPREAFVEKKGNYKIQDLGDIQLTSYPLDNVYDWGHCILYEDGIYKMWWCRYAWLDTIWYAESTDLKNWYNEKMVVQVKRGDPLKDLMIGWPDVVKVDGTYYMYTETAGYYYDEETHVGQCGIFLLTSSDGIQWDFWPSNEDPQPVIGVEEQYQLNGTYGSGQPNVFYKDGTFYLYYTECSTGPNYTRLATSKDGIHFDGTPTSHTIIIDRAGASVRYNEKTDMYYCTFILDQTQESASLESNEVVYVMESNRPDFFPYNKNSLAARYCSSISDNSVVKLRGNSDFVTNEHGIVVTETMLLIHMEGNKSETSDHMEYHNTWDGHLVAVLPKPYIDREFTLPDGLVIDEKVLTRFTDLEATWKPPTLESKYGTPVVDGEMDEMWKDASEAWIQAPSFNAAGNVRLSNTETYGIAKSMWDEDNIYFYIEVKDEVVSYSSRLAYTDKDGVNIYIDYTSADRKVATITADGKKSKKCECAVRFTEDGYVLEIAYSLKDNQKEYVAEGLSVALEISINDDFGDGKRGAEVFWSDYLGDASDISRRGTLCFVK